MSSEDDLILVFLRKYLIESHYSYSEGADRRRPPDKVLLSVSAPSAQWKAVRHLICQEQSSELAETQPNASMAGAAESGREEGADGHPG